MAELEVFQRVQGQDAAKPPDLLGARAKPHVPRDLGFAGTWAQSSPGPGGCTAVPISYLTHFSVSGETLALINSALLPASAFTNRNPEAIFNPPTPTARREPAVPPGLGKVSAPAAALGLSWLVLLFTGVI